MKLLGIRDNVALRVDIRSFSYLGHPLRHRFGYKFQCWVLGIPPDGQLRASNSRYIEASQSVGYDQRPAGRQAAGGSA